MEEAPASLGPGRGEVGALVDKLRVQQVENKLVGQLAQSWPFARGERGPTTGEQSADVLIYRNGAPRGLSRCAPAPPPSLR